MTFLWGTQCDCGAELGEAPGTPVSLGVQVTAGLTGCSVVCDYWKPTLSISENGRRVVGLGTLTYLLWPWSAKSTAQQHMWSVHMCTREHVQCWEWTQGLSHPKQARHHWAPSPTLSRQDLIKLCWLVLNSPYSPSRPRSHKSSCLSHPNSWD